VTPVSEWAPLPQDHKDRCLRYAFSGLLAWRRRVARALGLGLLPIVRSRRRGQASGDPSTWLDAFEALIPKLKYRSPARPQPCVRPYPVNDDRYIGHTASREGKTYLGTCSESCWWNSNGPRARKRRRYIPRGDVNGNKTLNSGVQWCRGNVGILQWDSRDEPLHR